jgi:hypothetical protein
MALSLLKKRQPPPPPPGATSSPAHPLRTPSSVDGERCGCIRIRVTRAWRDEWELNSFGGNANRRHAR